MNAALLGYLIGSSLMSFAIAAIIAFVVAKIFRGSATGHAVGAVAGLGAAAFLLSMSIDEDRSTIPLIGMSCYLVGLGLWWSAVRSLKLPASGWRRLHAVGHVVIISFGFLLSQGDPWALGAASFVGALLFLGVSAAAWVKRGFTARA